MGYYHNQISPKMITEWKQFYVDYPTLKELLYPFRQLYQAKKACIEIIDDAKLEDLEKFNSYYETYLYSQLRKVVQFFNSKVDDCINKGKPLLWNIMKLKEKSAKENMNNKQIQMLKDAFTLYLKEIYKVDEYYMVNYDLFKKITDKHTKYLTRIYNNQVTNQFSRVLQKSKLITEKSRLQKFMQFVEGTYLSTFYSIQNRRQGLADLKKISQTTLGVVDNSSFGLLFGFAMAFVLAIILFGGNEILTFENQIFNEQFPIFRGISTFILYIWVLSFTVYAWSKYGVNYQVIFRFNNHFSDFSQILRRASVFTLLFFIMLLWFLTIITFPESKIGITLNTIIPKEYNGLIVWIVFFGYLFFPSFSVFNGEGRKYTLKYFLKTIIAPLIKITYPMRFIPVQLASFGQPLKDMSYMICYYINRENVGQCLDQTNFFNGWFISMVPDIIGTLVFTALWIREKKLFPPTGNFSISFIIDLIAIIFSYFAIYNPENYTVFLTLSIILNVINTINLLYIDIKLCWGFFESNSNVRFLRSYRACPHIWMYYAAMIIDFPLRVLWTININPNIYINTINPQLLQMVFGFIDILRGGMWNYLIVEYLNTDNINQFKVVLDVSLPYPSETTPEVSSDMDKCWLILHTQYSQFFDAIPRKSFKSLSESCMSSLNNNNNIDLQNSAIEIEILDNDNNNNYANTIVGSPIKSKLSINEVSSLLKYEKIDFKPDQLKKILNSGPKIKDWIKQLKEFSLMIESLITNYIEQHKIKGQNQLEKDQCD